MGELRAPLRTMLRDPADRERQEELCRRALARRRASRATAGRPRRRFEGALVAVAAALVLTTGWWWLGRGREPTGPVQLSGGGALEVVAVATDGRPQRLALTDGSVLDLEPGARLEPVINDGKAVRVRLTRGAVDFDIHPGGSRSWTVEAGQVIVRVVATRFRVERAGAVVTVGVTRGVVTVEGELVQGGLRRLIAGESLELSPAVAPAPALPERPTTADGSPGTAGDRGPGAAGDGGPGAAGDGGPLTLERPRPGRSWRELASAGAFQDAFTALGSEGVVRETRRAATLEELLTLADVARLSGHPRDAVEPLERGLALYPSDRRAPVAAFTLGRLHLHFLGNPSRAAGAFERCIALGPPRALREDAYVRLTQARAQSGDAGGAREAARSYLSLFPEGRWAEGARRIIAGER